MNNYKKDLERLNAIKTELNTFKDLLLTIPFYEKEKRAEIDKEIQVLSIQSKYIVDNAKLSFFNEYMPQVKNILSSFNRKKYGPKTKETIYQAIKEKLNIGFWIDQNNYHSMVNIYPLDNNGFTDYTIRDIKAITHETEKFLLTDDNKINAAAYPFTPCNISKEYVNNTRGAALDVLRKIEKAKAMERELNTEIDEINKMLPESAGYISKSYTNFPKF